MPALSHVGLGLAAKRFTPKIQVVVLVIAALALDILAGLFWLAAILHILPTNNVSWSHVLFISVHWSVIAGLLTARIYGHMRIGAIIGILVFSHWLLDFLMWPPSPALLYAGGPAIGLNLGNPISIAIAIEFGVLIIGIVIYIRSQTVRAHYL